VGEEQKMTNVNNLIGSVLGSGLRWLSRRRLPKISGSLKLIGLNSSVEVLRDKWGVPHIYASNLDDLFFAQGFVEAQDRLFQMELNRRTAQGLLSELFGAIALDTDRAVRCFGFNRLGKIDWQNASEDTKLAFEAYTKGVNAFLNHPESKLPVEFTLLNHKPKAWEAEDCTAFARVMMWQLSHAWYGEIIRAQLAEAVGEEHAQELEIQYPAQNPLILPQGIEFRAFDPDGKLARMQGPFLKQNMGSNAWAIAGKKSDTGGAYLCNDMHLALGTPCIWYEVHLNAPDYHASGVSLPGEPGVMVGHNDQIAWGMTLAFTDCEDLFIEKFNPNDPSLYQFKDEWRKAEIIEEVIPVKGQKLPHIEKVRITHHGPIISNAVGFPEKQIAVNSMALKPSPSLRPWLMLNQAKNWNEFVQAMEYIDAPQLNVSYADRQGNIGHWVTGKVPIRLKGDGRVPAPGWDGEYEWVGEVPFNEMPHALNPTSDILINTNNKIIADDYPHFLGNAWMNGYRARRIEDIIGSKDKLGVEDFKNLHLDFTCLPGIELVKILKTINSKDPDINQALAKLNTWDGVLAPDSVGGCVYSVARYFIVRNMVEAELGQELTNRWMGQSFNSVLLNSHEFYGSDTTTMLRLINQPDSWWITQAGGRDALLIRGLKQATNWLRENLGGNPDGWQWGKIHHAVFPHPLGLQKPLDLVFNRGPVPIGGDTDTPCQTGYKPDAPFDNNAWGPSFRQIVDLNDLSKSVITTVPGQSGHIGSQHYDDFIQSWLEGKYHPMLWDRLAIEKECEGKLLLEP
jgi:penicillin amidase